MAAVKYPGREALRSELTRIGLTALQIRDLSDESIGALMVVARSSDEDRAYYVRDSSWVWPQSMFPVQRFKRTISFDNLALFPKLCLDLKRFVLASMMFPLRRFSDIAGLKFRVTYLSKLCAIIGRTIGDCYFDEISELRFQEGFAELASGLNSSTVSRVGRVAIEVCEHAGRQNIPRGFGRVPIDVILRFSAGVDAVLPERPYTAQEEAYGVYQPLPDLYLSEVGPIWTYYTRHLLPNFVQLAPLMAARVDCPRRKVWGGNSGALTKGTVKIMQQRRRRDVLRAFPWIDASGNPIRELPFSMAATFPPKTFADYRLLLSSVQSSLMQMVALFTGARSNEVAWLRRDCVEITSGPRGGMPTISGASYKSSAHSVGDERVWPIPRDIADAIVKMQAISEVLLPDSEWLWVGTNPKSSFAGVPNCYYATMRSLNFQQTTTWGTISRTFLHIRTDLERPLCVLLSSLYSAHQ